MPPRGPAPSQRRACSGATPSQSHAEPRRRHSPHREPPGDLGRLHHAPPHPHRLASPAATPTLQQRPVPVSGAKRPQLPIGPAPVPPPPRAPRTEACACRGRRRAQAAGQSGAPSMPVKRPSGISSNLQPEVSGDACLRRQHGERNGGRVRAGEGEEGRG